MWGGRLVQPLLEYRCVSCVIFHLKKKHPDIKSSVTYDFLCQLGTCNKASLIDSSFRCATIIIIDYSCSTNA